MRFFYSFILTLATTVLLNNIVCTAQTSCTSGFIMDSGVSYPCSNTQLYAFMTDISLGATSMNDVWGWTDPITGTEYVLAGMNTGTAFIDISTPTAPVHIATLLTHTTNSSWRDIKVINDHAYIGSEAVGHGIQVYDLTQLSTLVSPFPVMVSETNHITTTGAGNSHNVVADTEKGFLHVVGSGQASGGLVMFDVNDPTNIQLAGTFEDDGYTHDAVCFVYNGPDLDYVGSDICIGSNEDTQTIVDVSDKSNPVQLSRTTYVNERYTHQGWVTDDHRYLLFNDELDEALVPLNTTTHIWSIEDLDNPTLIGTFVNTTAAIDHNLYVNGNYVFESNYRSGLRILEMTDLSTASLTEVAYFDVYPANDNSGFQGAWSSYPYFKSGIIPVTHIQNGLFLISSTVPYFNMKPNCANQEVCLGDDATFSLDFSQFNGFVEDVSSLTITGHPAGSVVTTSLATPFASNAMIDITISNTAAVPAGKYSILVEGATATEKHDISLGLTIRDVPGTNSLAIPVDGATDIDNPIVLIYSADAEADTYEIEIATDAAFTNIVQTTTSETSTSYTATGLIGGVTYFWRVRGANACGNAAYQTAFSFTTRTVLPLTLINFSAEAMNHNIQLAWQTIQEEHFREFQIERSTNSIDFQQVGVIEATGNQVNEINQYDFIDESVEANKDYFYRLKMMDDDETFEYSDVVVARINKKLENDIAIATNPIQNILNIQLTASQNDMAQIDIYSLDGRRIQSLRQEIVQGDNEVFISTPNLKAGVYILNYTSASFQKPIRFVKLK